MKNEEKNTVCTDPHDDIVIKKLQKVDAMRNTHTTDEIISEIDKILEYASKNKLAVWITFLRGEKAYYKKDYEESFRLTHESVVLNPNNYYIVSSLGVDYYINNYFEEAIELFSKAINLNSKFYEAYINRATAYRKIQENDKALEDAEYVIKNAKDTDLVADAKESKARTLLCIFKYNEAIKIFEEILAKGSENPELLEGYANALECVQQYENAIKQYKRALSFSKNVELSEAIEIKLQNLNDIIRAKQETGKVSETQNFLSRLSIHDSGDRGFLKKIDEHIKKTNTIMDDYISKKHTRGNESYFNEDCVVILKGWSSSTPLFASGVFEDSSVCKGGGIYIRYQGKGIVIDPGNNFIDNFHKMGFYINDIDFVITTHNHFDHAFDVEKIIDLDYEIYKNKKKKIKYYFDRETYEEYHRKFDFESGKETTRVQLIVNGTIEPCNEMSLMKGIKLHTFPTHHSQASIGIKIVFSSKNSQRTIGYTSDTGYFKELSENLDGCDMIIANFSETNAEDIKEEKFKETHLGYSGCKKLINEMKNPPQICAVSEFWGGKGDIRIEIAKKLHFENTKKETRYIPADIGLVVFMDDLSVMCTSCNQKCDVDNISSIRMNATKPFGKIEYICKDCIYHF